MDVERACADNVEASLRLRAGGVDAILLECTNMPPYRAAIESACGVPVYSLIDAVQEMYESIV